MKKIAIIPDIKGWVVDDMANNIIEVLSNEFKFTKFYMEEEPKWNYEYEKKFDIIYIMLPSYLKKGIKVKKYRTTFHGGPGVEGQADQINRFNLSNIKISYVANQVKERVNKYNLKNIKFFTPHGINEKEYNIDNQILQDKLRCGYAGWLSYILENQKNHRRIYWIINAQKKLNFNLYFAGGLKKYIKSIDKKVYNEKFKKSKNIFLDFYEKSEIKNFYKKINCYLVPDKYAGGPMPVLEAGIMGIPIITTNAGLCGDIIENNKNGLLISNYDSFLKAIKYLNNNPDERSKLGNNLRDYILKNRTWNKVKNYWKEFLQ